jgi:hypothetical protein
MKLNLKPPGTERLRLKCDDSHSTLAFNLKLRRYNEAAMPALALRMPHHGTYDLTFTTVPVDPKLTQVSIEITVQPGRAHHIGIAAPCADKYPYTACDADTEIDDGSNIPCTCSIYNVSAIVPLSPLRAYILDGGENALGSSHTPVCGTGTASCTGQTITLLHDAGGSGMCALEVQEAVDTPPPPAPGAAASLAPPAPPVAYACAATQPTAFTGVTSAGAYTFSNFALVAPSQAGQSSPFLLSFNSPGLIGVSFGLEIRPGVAVSLGRAVHPALTATGSKRLKLGYDELLSKFAFKFNLRRYIWGWCSPRPSTPPSPATSPQ